MILNFRTDRSGQTVQTQIRLLLEEQSDEGVPLFAILPFQLRGVVGGGGVKIQYLTVLMIFCMKLFFLNGNKENFMLSSMLVYTFIGMLFPYSSKNI